MTALSAALVAILAWGRHTEQQTSHAAKPSADVSADMSATLAEEIRALTSLVKAQSERLEALEALVKGGAQTSNAVRPPSPASPAVLMSPTPPRQPPPPPQKKKPSPPAPKKKPPPPPKKKRPPPPPSLPKKKPPPPKRHSSKQRSKRRSKKADDNLALRPATLSPHLRLVAAVRCDAPLVTAAIAPSAVGTAPRFVVAVDNLGRLHVFDSVGRALMPPSSLIPDAPAPVRVLALAFLAPASTGTRTAQATPALLAAAIVQEGTADVDEGFTYCLYRIAASPNPTPEQRVVVDLVRESNVTWPATPADDSDEASSMQDHRLVALETMTGTSNQKSGASSPAFLAVRSDGLLVTLTSAGAVLAGVSSKISGVHTARKSGTTLALLSDERVMLVELTKRAPPRDCAVPEALAAAGGRLTSITFDAHVSQLLYVSTSLGSVLVFNSRARPVQKPDENVQASKGAAPQSLECRWLDNLAVEPGSEQEPSQALSSVKGYLLALGEESLSARNVSTIYHTSDPQPAALVHFEPLDAVEVEDGLQPFMLGSGSMLVVQGGEDGSGSLRIYSSSLPYDPPAPPTWPKYVMGILAVGITGIYQLYKRKSKATKDASKDDARNDRYGGRGGRGFGGRGGLGSGGGDDDPFTSRYSGGRPGQGGRSQMGGGSGRDAMSMRHAAAAGAEAHYAAHMSMRNARAGQYADDSD